MLMRTPGQPAISPLLTGEGRSRGDGWWRWAMFALWLLLAGWLVSRHVMWRDEVRAFTLALSGDGLWAMLRNIHGEGHPALWYLLLRGGHALVGNAALPGIAFLIAIASAALLAWRAPFRPAVIALVLFSAYALVDYTVVARNYGISMLLMLLIADRYAASRDRGVTLGVLLALLCNSNAPSVLLAGGVLLFWAIEIWLEQGWRWTVAVRQWLLNAAITGVGVVACVAVLYPPYNDAASLAAGGDGLLPLVQLSAGLHYTWAGATLFAAVLIGSLLGLVRAPAALIATVVVTIAATLFFQLVYPGLYRHQALVLVFLIAMYWLAARGRGGRWTSPHLETVGRYGEITFVGLLALQSALAVALVNFDARVAPFSRSRDLGQLLRAPALRQAVVIGNPDVVLEPLSYYAPNPTYFVRERRWGRVVAFTKAAMRDVSLGEMLDSARRLHARTGRPIVIVLHDALVATRPTRVDQGYLGDFTTTPAEVRAFQAATDRLTRFGEAQTDETYTVYRLRAP